MTSDLRDKVIGIRLNEKEELALDRLTQVFNEPNRSRVVRKMIRESIGEGPDLLKEDLNVFKEGIRQVGALGRNINQIARAINSGQAAGMTVDHALLYNVSTQIAALEAELKSVVSRSIERWVKHA